MSAFPLDQFRAFLDHMDETERADQLHFFRLLDGTGSEVVGELAPRAFRVTASQGLRLLAAEASYYHPWPEWVSPLARFLRHETDPGIFATCVQALTRIGNGAALAALKELNGLRHEPAFQEILAEALAQSDPTEAFRYHLKHLLLGSSNPGAANDAAQRMLPLLDAASLEPLKKAVLHPDLLVFRHALRLICALRSPEATAYLEGFLAESHLEVLDDRRLKEALAALRPLPPAAAREEAMKQLEELAEDGPHAEAGHLEQALQAALDLAMEGKGPRLQAHLNASAEALHLRARRLATAVDTAAEGLAEVAAGDEALRARLLPQLQACFVCQSGREGVARALASLLPAEDAAAWGQLLAAPDNAMRAAALEALGQRGEEALRPILLQACRDAIEEVALRARQDLGRLPGLEDLTRELLHGERLEDQQLALHLATLHRLAGLGPELLELARTSPREELALDALRALGASGPEGVETALLELLHSGQGPRMQAGLAEALRDLGRPEAALGLSAKAAELKSGLLHTLALEALAAVPPAGLAGQEKRILGHLKAAWQDRDPWPLRLRCVRALLHLDPGTPEARRQSAQLVQDALVEKRAPGAWSPAELEEVQEAAKELARRAG